MISTCLENLEDLGKKGVDMEVICNTAGGIYAGRSCFTLVCYPSNPLVQGCQTPFVSSSLLRADRSHSPLDKHCHE